VIAQITSRHHYKFIATLLYITWMPDIYWSKSSL